MKDGRGPFRPGLTMHWVDAGRVRLMPTLAEDFGDLQLRLPKRRVGAYGCAVRTLELVGRWFTPAERERLLEIGYVLVRIEVDRVVAESDVQCIFYRARGLLDGVRETAWPA